MTVGMTTQTSIPVNPNSSLRVGIIDPNPLERDLLAIGLQQTLDATVNFAVPTFEQIPADCERFDILIMATDHLDPESDALGSLTYWQVRFQECQLLLIGPRPLHITLHDLVRCGIHGYIVHDTAQFAELVEAIAKLRTGKLGFCQTAQSIFDQPPEPSIYFTPREYDVIVGLRELGTRRRKEAANRMGISYNTYSEYVRRICHKLKVGGIDDILERCEGVV